MATPPRPGSLASRLGQASTVLVVEDEPDIATFLGAFFRASGTEVVHVDPSSVAEVIEMAIAVEASCALLDLSLRGLSGFDILEAIHDDPQLSMMPVVIVTADARTATREQAVGLGAAAFIPKPFNVKDLFATVKALVEGDPLLEPTTAGEESKAAMVRRSALRGGLLPADVIHDALGDAISSARRGHDSAAFALLRVLGPPGGQPAVISELATVLAKAMPAADVLGSTAPDELAVLFAGASAATAVRELTNALGEEPLTLTLPAGRTITINLAVGVAASPEHAVNGDELYMAADAALASAVESGETLATAR